jgi:methionine-rich copper-binding protein CopC
LHRPSQLLLIFAVLLSGWAFAHARITSTIPADGDFVAAPQELILEFDNPVRLTGITLNTVEGDSREIEQFPAEQSTSFSIGVPENLPPGEYFVVWKSIAADSHFSTGEFFFTVIAD